MDLDKIRIFAISKLGWIKQQQKKLQEQERETPREYLDLESHYVWGKRYLLKIIEVNEPPSVELKHNKMILRVRPGTDDKKKWDIVDALYREQLKEAGLRDNVLTMVGGAPVTQDWAEKIGADLYAENSVDAIVKCKAALE